MKSSKTARSSPTAPRRLTPAELPAPDWWPAAAEALLAAHGYGPQGLALTPNPEPLDGLIRLILAQQNTWAVAQRQWEALKAAYPRWEAALLAEPDEIAAVLKGAGGGLAQSKAKSIWGILQRLAEERGQPSLRFLRRLPPTEARAFLQGLPGVGRRTASLLLLFHLAQPAAAVDGNIERLLHRLEVVPPGWKADRQEEWLEGVLPADAAYRAAFHRAGVRHGREICTRRDPACPACVLRTWCSSAQFFMGDGNAAARPTD
ncbi:endonuclease III domain-containing protein [Deinococcus sp. Marseille-Q6407]|uniref:endonuclease III domain-containing protein n=1 Tax=Deinococcus sp. Marseille-Q6407 TaxID=2969223 RepID=UPI0021C0C937|nr:endonuclease III [Deinococcus sp. Marseille-Q6407]